MLNAKSWLSEEELEENRIETEKMMWSQFRNSGVITEDHYQGIPEEYKIKRKNQQAFGVYCEIKKGAIPWQSTKRKSVTIFLNKSGMT